MSVFSHSYVFSYIKNKKILDYKSLENAITKINISKENIKKYEKIKPHSGVGGSNTLIKPHKKFINDCDEKLNYIYCGYCNKCKYL